MLKYFTFLVVSVVLSVSTYAEETAWPLIPTVAKSLKHNSAENLLVGSFYFHYLNEDYQSAYNQLTNLRTKQQVNTVVLDVLETTLLLALGLEDQALNLFKEIEADNASVPAQAWLYLARRWQTLANWPLAEEAANNALRNQTQPLAFKEAQEALYILVECSTNLEDTRSANNYFRQMEERGKWTEYARHNLLVASIQGYATIYEINRQVEEAIYFSGDTQESQALKDRILLLGAVYMLEEKRYAEADKYLKLVRQNGPYSAPALLEYGWAKFEQGRYSDALQPWRELLTQYEDWHPAVIESILAVPHTMELMNAETQALYGYETVEKRLLSMLAELKEQQQSSTITHWLDNWLNQQQGEWGWRRHNNVIDQTDTMSHSLMALLANSSVRSQLDGLYDLKRIQQDLNSQLTQLSFWQETAYSRQQHLRNVNGSNRLATLEQRYSRVMPAMDKLETEYEAEQKSPLAYASATEKIQVERIKKMVPLIKGLKENASPDLNLKEYMERWRRARGVLVWQMAKGQPQDEWLVTKEMWQLRTQVAQLNHQLNRSQAALNWSKTDWQGYAQRIENTKNTIRRLQADIRHLEQQQQQQIVATVQANLEQQQEKLTHYLAQARLSLARLYDNHLQLNLATTEAGGEQ